MLDVWAQHDGGGFRHDTIVEERVFASGAEEKKRVKESPGWVASRQTNCNFDGSFDRYTAAHGTLMGTRRRAGGPSLTANTFVIRQWCIFDWGSWKQGQSKVFGIRLQRLCSEAGERRCRRRIVAYSCPCVVGVEFVRSQPWLIKYPGSHIVSKPSRILITKAD